MRAPDDIYCRCRLDARLACKRRRFVDLVKCSAFLHNLSIVASFLENAYAGN